MNKASQIKFYKSILKDNEILLLKSSDSFFGCHYSSSPLNVLTNFSGTSGEAVIDKSGNIKLFVDTRYHLLADKITNKDVQIYKMQLAETFFDSLKKIYKKNTVLHVPCDILLKDYLKYDSYFDVRKYTLKDNFAKNNDINLKNSIFIVDKEIERQDFSFKINKLKKNNFNIDKMLVFDLDEIAYLTNLRSFQMQNSSLFSSILYLDFKNSNYVLFADGCEKIKIENLNILKLSEFNNYIQSIQDEIHVDVEKINVKNYLLIKKPKEIKNNNLSLYSSVKSISVIKELEKSFSKLDKAIFNFKNQLKAGLSEYDLKNIFEKELLKQGAKTTSFKTIMALDSNSASIHYTDYDKNKILQDEMLFLLDCGGYWDGGYATDITRTFYFGSRPSLLYKKIYTNVLKAFINCFLSKETNASKVDYIARKILKPFEKCGFKFNHGLGHGIGTSVHQNPPRLSISSDDIIKPYQVHSIEPGLYGKDIEIGLEFGVRIENCVYWDVEYNRYSLSKFPFEEVLIDYGMLNEIEADFVKKWQESF